MVKDELRLELANGFDLLLIYKSRIIGDQVYATSLSKL